MAGVDFTGDIERIIEILSENTVLKDTIRSFKFGESEGLAYDLPAPFILVTVPDRPFQTNDRFGIGEGAVDSQHTVQYLVKITVDTNNSENAERELYTIIKQVTDSLNSNPRLKKPTTSDDPKCIRSFVFDIPIDGTRRGQERLVATVGIQCQKGSGFSISLPGLGDIPLIRKPIENELENVENVVSTGKIRKDTSPVSETHLVLAEFEYDYATLESIRTTKRNRAVISVTIKRPTVTDETFNGKITQISNGAGFDELETIVIGIERFH